MALIGPELPPHLAKRKRSVEAHDNRPRTPSPSAKESKLRRVVGPSAPPPALSERPDKAPNPDAESSDSDDDFGPSLPPASGPTRHEAEDRQRQALADNISDHEATKKPQREEWMLVPPKQDDWSGRVDPTKLKNRKFNSGKGSKAPGQNGGNENALWTETPNQKRQRLEDEVMGVKKPAQLGPEDKKESWNEDEARETERRIREYNEKNRNTSLYNEHKKAGPKEKEDDPSARAFDKEKDIGAGMKIGHAQKKEMLDRAKDFGSRFAGGNYL